MWNLIKQFLISSIEANKEVINHCKKNQDYIDFMLQREKIDLEHSIITEKQKKDVNFTKLGYFVALEQNLILHTK